MREVPKVIVEAIEQEAPEVIADAIELEAPEHGSPDGIKQGNNGSQVPILKETSEIPICDIAANGISSCSVSHSTKFTGVLLTCFKYLSMKLPSKIEVHTCTHIL